MRKKRGGKDDKTYANWGGGGIEQQAIDIKRKGGSGC